METILKEQNMDATVDCLVPKLFPVVEVLDVTRIEMSELLLSWNRWIQAGPMGW